MCINFNKRKKPYKALQFLSYLVTEKAMARIIRTTPKSRKRVSLRVVFSFLLIMQIQLPNAHEANPAKTTDLSFYLAGKATPHISLTAEKAKPADLTSAPKAN